MSGGGTQPHPDYDEATPKKRINPFEQDPAKLDRQGRKKPIELPSPNYGVPLKTTVIPPDLLDEMKKGRKMSGVYWYDCDTCGKVHRQNRRAREKFIFDSPECLKKHRQKLYTGLPPPKEQRRAQSKRLKEKYRDPEFRERQRKMNNDPKRRMKISNARKKWWKDRKRVRTETDDRKEAFYASSEWKRQCKRVFAKNNYGCAGCGKPKSTVKRLSGHHSYPLSDWINEGYKPEEYPDDWVYPLCERCHPSTDSQSGVFKLPRAPDE